MAGVPDRSPHLFTRRRFIAGAVIGGSAAAAGGITAALLGRGGDSQPSTAGSPETPSAVPSPTPNPTSTPLPAAVGFLEPATGAFERRQFAPDEPILWSQGVFFMDTTTGALTGYRVAGLESQTSEAVTAFGPRFVQAHAGTLSNAMLLDRSTDREWRWDGSRWRLLAASESFLVFGEAANQRDTGRYVFATAALDSAVEFRSDVSTWSSWIVHEGVAAVSFQDHFDVQLVDLASGQSQSVFTAPTEIDGMSPLGVGLVTSSRDTFDIRVPYSRGESSNGGPYGTEAFLIQRTSWDGGPLESLLGPEWFESVSPDGEYRVRDSALFWRPSVDLGSGEIWPAAVVVDRAGREQLRVRSATVVYGDWLPHDRWLADSSGFVAMIVDNGDPPIPSTPYGYAIITRDGKIQPLPAPPVAPNSWYTNPRNNGPVPSPTDADLFSFGHYYLYNRRTDAWIVPDIRDENGPLHLSPWSGEPGEMVFGIGHGGHDGGQSPALITPLVERAPFAAAPPMRFRVAGTGSCLNLREQPGLDAPLVACLADGTELRLHPDGAFLWEEAPQAYSHARTQDGDWAMVTAPGAGDGWVSTRYLEWAG